MARHQVLHWVLWLVLAVASGLPAGGPSDCLGDSEGHSGSSALRPTATRQLPGRFYLYNERPLNHSRLLRRIHWPNVSAPWNPRYQLDHMPEPFLLQALRRHPLRTHDPGQATVFIVPLLITVSHLAGRCVWNDYRPDRSASCETHWRRLQASTRALRATSHWKAHKGADHVLICHHWQCLWDASFTGPLHRAFRRSIVYLFEGTGTKATDNDFCRRVNCVPMGHVHPVLPYVDNPHRWQISVLAHPYPRSLTVFFSGSSNRSVWYNIRPHMAVLRAEVAAHLPPLASWTVVDYGSRPTPRWSAEQMLRAKFCLCPAGDSSTSARIYYAIAAGCVPVIISHPDIWRSLPFQRLLDWQRFAVFVNDTDFQAGPLRAVLRALQAAPYASLRRALQQVQRLLSILHPRSCVAHALVADVLLLRATLALPS